MRALASIAALGALAACGSNTERAAAGSSAAAPATTARGAALTGAGATFPNPIYAKWFRDYAAKTGVQINYQSIGSGGGIRQIQEQTVDFGASDAPMTDDELAKAKGGALLHFPTVLGAVAVTYNLAEVSGTLKLDGPTLAGIYLGTITKWNDSRMVALNPGVRLPDRSILVSHRSDGSGTTYIFSDYLSAVSPVWAKAPGKGKELQWPVGLGGKGNEGVSGVVKQTPGAIGYVELAYAKQNKLPTVALKNPAGNFVQPSVESATAAAAGATARMGPTTDYRVSIVNAAGAQAYPISSFTWLLVYRSQPNATKGRQLVDFLRWAYSDGEQSAATLDYAPLPETLASRLRARLDSIAVGAR